MSKPLYAAVILDKSSHRKLVNHFIDLGILTDEYKPIAHHMTIKFGDGLDNPELLGKKVRLKAISYGFDEKVIAVKVLDAGLSENKTPHVTVGVNYSEGGKPVMSNNLKFKYRISPITLTGTIEDVYSGVKISKEILALEMLRVARRLIL